jgi:putative flavoprotein involved in K+ transport
MSKPEYFETVVIGGGQAGLAVGYHLAERGRSFVILDASARIGDAWRNRWDSLRLFTPAAFDGLPGMPFPAPSRSFPTKNEMADYLEQYASRFALPVRSGARVEHLTTSNGRFVLSGGSMRVEAHNVVIAMSTYQHPRVPSFARELHPDIVQLHSWEYRAPSQLADGDVLIVGAGNSGSEIAMELARTRQVWMSGRDTGHLPFRLESHLGAVLVRVVLRGIFHRVMTLSTPVGRKARPKVISKGGPLIRVKPSDLAAAGVQRVLRTAGVRDGLPVLEDDRVLHVSNVVWCTGFEPGFSWIDIPVFDSRGEPRQHRGVVRDAPGLYFVGLHFLYALSSTMIHGVGRDAEHVVRAIDARTRGGEEILAA